GIATGAHGLLRDVTDAVADIERRVTMRVQIEVEEVETFAGDQHLVWIEVAVEPDRLGGGRRYRGGEPVACREQPPQAVPPPPFPQVGPLCRERIEALVQDAELVRHGVLAPRRYVRDVKLVSRLREPARQRH